MTENDDVPRPAARGRDRRHRSPGRPHRINLRLDDAELDAVTEAATSAGLTPSGYCAEAALAAARDEDNPENRRVLQRVARELFAARSAINRFGANVNQVAAAFNSTGILPEYAQAAIELCRRSVERVDAAVAELRRRLE